MRSRQSPSVIIIGAGLAGLSAARELAARGLTVQVIDARDRVGGRVWTVREPFAGGQHAEAGGELIEAGHTRMRALVRECGLSLAPVLHAGFGSYRVDVRGRVRRGRQHRFWADLARLLRPALDAHRRAGGSWDSPIARAFARRSVAQLLADLGGDAAMQAGAVALRGFYLADPERLSSLVLLDQFGVDDDPADVGQFHIRGGADRLPAAMARALGARVRLGLEARRVEQTRAGVRVTVRDRGGRREQLTADAAIVAVPAALADRLTFVPRLPAEQRRAFAELPYGCATKTLLQFERAFWRRTGRPRAYGGDGPWGAVWDATEEQRGARAILVSLAGGAASAAAQARLARDGADGLARGLAWLGGRAADRRVTASFSVTWEADPWARGGYAYFDTAFDPALRRWLSAPAGRLFFAGEHTSVRWQGYMEGAVESGQRAATELLAQWALDAPASGGDAAGERGARVREREPRRKWWDAR